MGGPDNCDPAMIELFRAEMDTHLPVLSQGLLALEKERAGDKDLEAMMRAAHSIKGAARIVGVEAAVRVAHAMEDCFSAAQGRRITLNSETVDVLFQGVDALQKVCSPQADPAVTETPIQALLDRITAIRDGGSCPPPRPQTQESPAPPTAVQSMPCDIYSPQSCVTLPMLCDASAAELLRVELSDILRRKQSRIRLDFSQVRHLSTTALSLLASFAREIDRSDPPPAVAAEGVSAEMVVLLRATGLDSTFTQGE
jgi:chemotaxis protein histidine kinase CheA